MQRTIDNTTGTGRSVNPPNPDAVTTSGSTGDLTPAVSSENRPSGSNSANISAQNGNSANNAAQGENPSYVNGCYGIILGKAAFEIRQIGLRINMTM